MPSQGQGKNGKGRNFFGRIKTMNLWTPMLKDYNQDVDLSMTQADNLFRWQLSSDQPSQLNEGSCFMAGIVDSKWLSADTYKGLIKAGVLCPLGSYDLDTTRIDKQFSHHLAVLPLFRQRKLIGMLFHWEEELTRWRLLDEEEAEIRRSMQVVGGDDEDCLMGLQAVAQKRRLLPSERVEHQAAARQPPGYASVMRERGRPQDDRTQSVVSESLASWPTGA